MESYDFFFVMFLALHGCLEFSAGTCVSKWSYWVNRDNQTTGDGDHESMSTTELSSFCGDGQITHIECETVQGTPSYDTGEIVSCGIAGGLVCLKADNLPLYCSDYTVRYFCDCPVPVTNVQLQNGLLMNNNVMEVDAGVPITLSCHVSPSTSRPSPTIIWYIGSVEKQQSTSTTYTFTPSDTDHGKEIFCKAYNVQPASQAVESAKLIIYVRVPVTNAQLQRNGLTINSSLLTASYGEVITLTCNVSPSRPAPTIAWYIGSVLKQRSASTTYTFTFSEFTQHKTIYCKAYNLQLPSQGVVSAKPMLYVNAPHHGDCSDQPGFPCSVSWYCSDAYMADKYCRQTCGRCHGSDNIMIG